MESNFFKVKNYLLQLECTIINEDEADGTFIIEDEDKGIKNMILACAEPILIIEQYLFEPKDEDKALYKILLQKNRDVIHGAFVLDESGKKVMYRDTLQLENLDLNELEASLNSLSLLLSEFSTTILKYSK